MRLPDLRAAFHRALALSAAVRMRRVLGAQAGRRDALIFASRELPWAGGWPARDSGILVRREGAKDLARRAMRVQKTGVQTGQACKLACP
jgi:hypothetical protein